MDYHSMKRRKLQRLCKKHHIPANSTNSVLADTLSELLNDILTNPDKMRQLLQLLKREFIPGDHKLEFELGKKQKPTLRLQTCMKREPAAASRREAKKVRFSPTNDLVEYELRSGKKDKDTVTETKNRRKSKVAAKPVDENKQNKRGVRDVEKADEGTVGGSVRVTRSKAQTLMEDDSIVEASKEIMDAPVRVTRSRGQTKVSDLSNNLSNVASENNQQL